MLTRRELEGQLRTVHPLRAQALARRQASVRMRFYARWAMISVLGVLVLMLAVLTVSSRTVAPARARQDATWGQEHVNGHGIRATKAFSMSGNVKKNRDADGKRRKDSRRPRAY